MQCHQLPEGHDGDDGDDGDDVDDGDLENLNDGAVGGKCM